MAIKVINKPLKKKIYKSINRYDNLAIKAYEKGNMMQGAKYEAKSDNLYKKYYHKIWG